MAFSGYCTLKGKLLWRLSESIDVKIEEVHLACSDLLAGEHVHVAHADPEVVRVEAGEDPELLVPCGVQGVIHHLQYSTVQYSESFTTYSTV